jgi:translation initiation factor 1
MAGRDEEHSRPVYSTDVGDLRKDKPAGSAPASADPSKPVRVALDTKGRRGKAVTMVTNIPHNPQVIENLARQLRNQCGAGGTVENGTILVQGDHRAKVGKVLEGLGYKVRII